MRELVRHIRGRLLAAEDTVCLERARLVTEAWREHASDPVCLRRAKAFAHVLRHMTLDVHSNPVFAGNTSSRLRGWMLVPEHGFGPAPQVMLENKGLEGLLDDAVPGDLLEFWAERSVGGNCDPGHLAVDLDLVVHEGLNALLARVQALIGAGSAEQRVYRAGMAVCLQAVIDWAGRYADAAEAAAAMTDDPVLAELHQRVSKACRRVPAEPARNLFEGLQAIALIHLALTLEGHGMSVSIGLPDRTLAPFVGAGPALEEATELIAAFMLKIAANSVFGRGSKTQAVTVGGADHTGRDQCTPLTVCFMNAADLARVGGPHLFLRWHSALDVSVKQRAAELLAAGLSMPLLINDAPTANGFIQAGMAPEDAWRYCVIGCNELGIPGLSAESATARAGNVQYLELLNHVLLEHPDPDAIGSMESVLELLEQAMNHRLREARRRYVEGLPRLAERAPVPFASCLMQGCIEAGADMTRSMRYRIPGLYERGLTNGANALAAIEELVFCEQSLTLSVLVEAMRSDFGVGTVRERLRAVPKWGNDDPRVDRWAGVLLEMRERVLEAIDNEYGHAAHMVCHVVRSLHHFDGFRIAASPDGRHAGAPVCDSIGAEAGTARSGPTSVLNSVAGIDTPRFYKGGYNLNLTLPKAETAPSSLLPLVETFFERGGQELQVNCLDAGQLRDAQVHPEHHGDLVVRYAGLSSRFIDLSAVEQDALIARAEAV